MLQLILYTCTKEMLYQAFYWVFGTILDELGMYISMHFRKEGSTKSKQLKDITRD
jgi:hypothetical protein